jgi:hypothetical protein
MTASCGFDREQGPVSTGFLLVDEWSEDGSADRAAICDYEAESRKRDIME